MSDEDEVALAAKQYLQAKHIPTLFEVSVVGGSSVHIQGMMTGLIHHRPDDPIDFMEQALYTIKHDPSRTVAWDMFVRAPPSASSSSNTSAVLTNGAMKKSRSTNDIDTEDATVPDKAYVEGFGVLKVSGGEKLVPR